MFYAICSDCALLAAYDGCGRGSVDKLSQRLNAPVAGLTVIPHSSHTAGGLSVVQVRHPNIHLVFQVLAVHESICIMSYCWYLLYSIDEQLQDIAVYEICVDYLQQLLRAYDGYIVRFLYLFSLDGAAPIVADIKMLLIFIYCVIV